MRVFIGASIQPVGEIMTERPTNRPTERLIKSNRLDGQTGSWGSLISNKVTKVPVIYPRKKTERFIWNVRTGSIKEKVDHKR